MEIHEHLQWVAEGGVRVVSELEFLPDFRVVVVCDVKLPSPNSHFYISPLPRINFFQLRHKRWQVNQILFFLS